MKFILRRNQIDEAQIEAYYTWNGREFLAFTMYEACLGDKEIVKTLDETSEVTVCFVMEAK